MLKSRKKLKELKKQENKMPEKGKPVKGNELTEIIKPSPKELKKFKTRVRGISRGEGVKA